MYLPYYANILRYYITCISANLKSHEEYHLQPAEKFWCQVERAHIVVNLQKSIGHNNKIKVI